MKSDRWVVQVGSYKVAVESTFWGDPAIFMHVSPEEEGGHANKIVHKNGASVIIHGHLIEEES